MQNTSLKFMKSKEITPHQFYFIDEPLYQQLLVKLKEQKGNGINISTVGTLDYDINWYLVLNNNKLLLNNSRVVDFNPNKKELYPPYYIIYGELKLESNNQPVLIVKFSRNIGAKVDLELLKKCTDKKRILIKEALNQDFIF